MISLISLNEANQWLLSWTQNYNLQPNEVIDWHCIYLPVTTRGSNMYSSSQSFSRRGSTHGMGPNAGDSSNNGSRVAKEEGGAPINESDLTVIPIPANEIKGLAPETLVAALNSLASTLADHEGSENDNDIRHMMQLAGFGSVSPPPAMIADMVTSGEARTGSLSEDNHHQNMAGGSPLLSAELNMLDGQADRVSSCWSMLLPPLLENGSDNGPLHNDDGAQEGSKDSADSQGIKPQQALADGGPPDGLQATVSRFAPPAHRHSPSPLCPHAQPAGPLALNGQRTTGGNVRRHASTPSFALAPRPNSGERIVAATAARECGNGTYHRSGSMKGVGLRDSPLSIVRTKSPELIIRTAGSTAPSSPQHKQWSSEHPSLSRKTSITGARLSSSRLPNLYEVAYQLTGETGSSLCEFWLRMSLHLQMGLNNHFIAHFLYMDSMHLLRYGSGS